MKNQDTVFADGMIVKRQDNAPEFVICNLSINVNDFRDFIHIHSKNGWVNLSVLKSKGGKPYAKLDTYEPKPTTTLAQDMENKSDGLPW